MEMLGDLDFTRHILEKRKGAKTERAIDFADTLTLPDEARTPSLDHYLEFGSRAIQKFRDQGADVDLSVDERLGVEAVIHSIGRPALLIQNGRFEAPPANWAILESKRANIERVIRSVGKIEKLIDGERKLLGTGFLVGKQTVMTNCHVLDHFGLRGERRWIVQHFAEPVIDYNGEYEAVSTYDFALEDVIFADPRLDLALIKVADKSPNGCRSPEPLILSASALKRRALYVVGYPAMDAYHTHPPAIISTIFADIFEVKRLQPGELLGVFDDEMMLAHDCSTLGGNSGSCIVNLDDGLVVGLHYRGTYLDSNFGIALWKLKDDGRLRLADLAFQ